MEKTRFSTMVCPIARSLERVGEWWSMLILRDAFAGRTRFDEFQKSLGIAPNMLTRRLAALVEAGMLETPPLQQQPPRDEYLLTERGRDFRTVLVALLAFGNRHFARRGRGVRHRRREDGRAGRADARRSRYRPAAGRPRLQSWSAGPAATQASQSALLAADAGVPKPTRRRAQAHDQGAPSLSTAVATPALPTGAVPAPARRAGDEPAHQRLLHGPIMPTLLLLAWPNVLVMMAQASTGLIETWWISRLGTDALAGMALVFPGFMMMTMLSAGAIGGGISSAVARALGSDRRADADALVLHAIVINVALGLATSALFLVFGRQHLRGDGRPGRLARRGAEIFERRLRRHIVLWLTNALASVIRGTGNMMLPSVVVCIGVVLLVPLSPLLIFGWGPVPAFGIAGGGLAVRRDQRAEAGRARLVHPLGPLRRAPAPRAAALADVRRHPARRRRRRRSTPCRPRRRWR